MAFSRFSVTEGGSTPTRCRQCRKPIVWPGLCYTCATGLPRQLRPHKDIADHAPPAHSAEELLGEARQRHASSDGLDGLQQAAS